MTIYQAIKKGTIDLKINGIETPKIKARLLMQFVLGKDRQYIIVHDRENLPKNKIEIYFNYIQKLIAGFPLQHITHQQEFMRLNFYVDENVLIPRPDTEVLVEEVIEIAKKNNSKKILDMCTGSGAIAVSLAKYLENVDITAVDVSKEALKISKKNAINNNVENKITFIESNLFENLPDEKYDIIVSNPPYVKKDVLKLLSEEVKKEPALALDGGTDGLDFYRKIIDKAGEYLSFKGFLCLEIGYDQKYDVIEILENNGCYQDIYGKKDLCENDRIVVANRRVNKFNK